MLAYFKTNPSLSSCAIEIKATNKNTIPEKVLLPHQKQALLAVKHARITHKIADNRTKLPFDAFMLVKSNAWVVACFTTKGICLVFDIEDWKGASFDTPANFIIKL